MAKKKRRKKSHVSLLTWLKSEGWIQKKHGKVTSLEQQKLNRLKRILAEKFLNEFQKAFSKYK